MEKEFYRKEVKAARDWLLGALREQAKFNKLPGMRVFSRAPRGDDHFGYYKNNSQFRGLLMIGVIPENLFNKVRGNENGFIRELRITVAHEFAHSMAEAMRQYDGYLSVPEWEEIYENEEDFAEDFGVCLESGDIRSYPFWDWYLEQVISIYDKMVEDQ